MSVSRNPVLTGRHTAEVTEKTVTVFLIGMRANRWWKVPQVLRVALAMPRMMMHLARTPSAGMLGSHQWLGRTTILLSYWRSPEDLQRFAADRDAPHLAPWRKFQKTLAGSGDVGVWHETYQVRSSDLEVIYSDMPAFGLAKATTVVPITAGMNTARARFGGAGR